MHTAVGEANGTAAVNALTFFNCLVETSEILNAVAHHVVKVNHMADSITIINNHSLSLSIPQDLPQRVDFIVAELVDSGLEPPDASVVLKHGCNVGLLGERIIPTFRHASKSLLAKGGRMIPASATVSMACIQSGRLASPPPRTSLIQVSEPQNWQRL